MLYTALFGRLVDLFTSLQDHVVVSGMVLCQCHEFQPATIVLAAVPLPELLHTLLLLNNCFERTTRAAWPVFGGQNNNSANALLLPKSSLLSDGIVISSHIMSLDHSRFGSRTVAGDGLGI